MLHLVRTINYILSQIVESEEKRIRLYQVQTLSLLKIDWSNDHVYQYKFNLVCEIVINTSEG